MEQIEAEGFFQETSNRLTAVHVLETKYLQRSGDRKCKSRSKVIQNTRKTPTVKKKE